RKQRIRTAGPPGQSFPSAPRSHTGIIPGSPRSATGEGPTVMLLVQAWALVLAPAAGGPGQYLDRPADWYRGAEAARVAAHILSFQAAGGGWPKNADTTAAPYAGDPARLRGTFDNGATTDELRFLARIRQATGEERYGRAFLKGLDHILKAQYLTGG